MKLLFWFILALSLGLSCAQYPQQNDISSQMPYANGAAAETGTTDITPDNRIFGLLGNGVGGGGGGLLGNLFGNLLGRPATAPLPIPAAPYGGFGGGYPGFGGVYPGFGGGYSGFGGGFYG